MSDETAFLRAILDRPADDAPRLVYADWLDDRGDEGAAAKSAFLRTTAAYAGAVRDRDRNRKALKGRLEQMARALDREWLAVVSQMPVENCDLFEFECPKQWENMTATDDPAVRFCDSCRKPVHYCPTIGDARKHAWAGECVAVDLGLPRRPGDLSPPRLLAGVLIEPPGWRERSDEE